MSTLRAIVCTLREAARRWTQLFWFFVAVTLATSVPVRVIESPFAAPHQPGLPVMLLNLVFIILLPAVNQCTILALLAWRPSNGETPWGRLANCLGERSWTLILIMLVQGLLMTLPVLALLLLQHDLAPIGLVVGRIACGVLSYFFLARLALATPHAVATGANADAAIRHSWTATRGSFWYVLGCLLFTYGLQDLVEKLFGSAMSPRDASEMSSVLVLAWMLGLVASFTTVVQWFAYLHLPAPNAAAPAIAE